MPRHSAFTLVELAIVLVIIGLIIGGVLAGSALIDSAAMRSQIKQVDDYKAAVATFQLKYNCLPGDCKNAANFGFVARGQYTGQGDGDGLIVGTQGNVNNAAWGITIENGETGVFWEDLSMAGLISGNFNTATSVGNNTVVTGTNNIATYLPVAKIGNGNFVYVWSGGYDAIIHQPYGDGKNYFGISAVTQFNGGWPATSCAALTVSQAFNIDTKVDDGLPQSGKVTAMYDTWGGIRWAINGCASGGYTYNAATNGPSTAAASRTSTKCYDNNNTAGATQQYTTSYGDNINCALSFEMGN